MIYAGHDLLGRSGAYWQLSSCRGGLPFEARVALLACVGGLAFLTRLYASDGFLHVHACLTIASRCEHSGSCAPHSGHLWRCEEAVTSEDTSTRAEDAPICDNQCHRCHAHTHGAERHSSIGMNGATRFCSSVLAHSTTKCTPGNTAYAYFHDLLGTTTSLQFNLPAGTCNHILPATSTFPLPGGLALHFEHPRGGHSLLYLVPSLDEPLMECTWPLGLY